MGVAVAIEVFVGRDALRNEALVAVVVDSEDLLEHVLVVLAECRRTSLPRQRYSAECVSQMVVGADVKAGERPNPLPGYDLRIRRQHGVRFAWRGRDTCV